MAKDRGDTRTLLKRAGLVASGTLASRVLGAVRDAVIAATFTLGATDVFWMAFTIPNALRVILGEGAVGGAFIPVFTEVVEREGLDRAKTFYAKLTGAMLAILAAVSALGVAFAPPIVLAYASGFHRTPGLFEETVLLTRIVFPYIFFMGVAALMTGALNARKHFAAPAFAPTLLNVAMIASPWVFAPLAAKLGLPLSAALALAAMVGGVLQVAVQLPAMRAEGLLLRPTWDLGDVYVRKAFGLLVPLLLGLGVYQLNVALSRQFTSFLPHGAMSYLYYGQRLVEIPQGMFALAVASAALPSISETIARGETEDAKRIFRDSLKLTLLVAIPSSIALMALAEPCVAVLFGRGLFDAHAIAQTGRSLFYQSAGIWAVASVRTVVPMFYGMNDTRTPVVASAVNLLVFGGSAFALLGPMSHAGIAAAISLASIAQLTALLVLLRKKAGRLGFSDVAKGAFRVFLASVVMGVVRSAVASVGRWHEGGNSLRNVGVLAAAGLGGILAFVAAGKALRMPELEILLAALKRRLGRR